MKDVEKWECPKCDLSINYKQTHGGNSYVESVIALHTDSHNKKAEKSKDEQPPKA